ncbi:cyclic-di-AMP-binding protein CbpB [Litchfieldia salsa]|uniref:CBS domain-containing protein n=1 Tax=Litchfieldia salsa TaxID=930152 RepID=A0A1H0RKN4_9BACI|nr:cyclic-di-AMP-binding protein CbpB [Litchfieldia salsa]SDP30021.1 CBS domain-containing protein [Litchfieldia salsa]
MVSLQREEFLEHKIKDLLILADKVAHVQIGNNLEHALLVLTKTGYTAVPVLDPYYKLHGLINTTGILDSILGLERIEFEQLEKMKVEQVMNKSIPRLNLNDTLVEGLKLVVDHPFVCVENNEQVFEGILTRRSILKLLKNDLEKS